MLNLSAWIEQFLAVLDGTFGDRVWFVGLQGSRGRGEATETSDIDMVVILDEVTPADIRAYSAMLDTMPHRELICGFLSGKTEILHWDAADLFQFVHDTTPLRGSLDALLPLLDDAAVQRAIRVGACNIYHGCVHNMLYEKSAEILQGLYKAAVFTVQAICFRQTGRYVRRQQEVAEAVQPSERMIVETFVRMKKGEAVDFDAASDKLFRWAGGWIEKA